MNHVATRPIDFVTSGCVSCAAASSGVNDATGTFMPDTFSFSNFDDVSGWHDRGGAALRTIGGAADDEDPGVSPM